MRRQAGRRRGRSAGAVAAGEAGGRARRAGRRGRDGRRRRARERRRRAFDGDRPRCLARARAWRARPRLVRRLHLAARLRLQPARGADRRGCACGRPPGSGARSVDQRRSLVVELDPRLRARGVPREPRRAGARRRSSRTSPSGRWSAAPTRWQRPRSSSAARAAWRCGPRPGSPSTSRWTRKSSTRPEPAMRSRPASSSAGSSSASRRRLAASASWVRCRRPRCSESRRKWSKPSARGGPVVALETTLIAHGFPPGVGVEVGLEAEARSGPKEPCPQRSACSTARSSSA